MKKENVFCIIAAAFIILLASGPMPGWAATLEEPDPEITSAEEETAQSIEYEPFIRIDRDDPEAAARPLENLRIITAGAYELGTPKPKYGIDPDFVPDLTGLDELNVSASAQFNERQFRELLETLDVAAKGKEIYVFDLRRESHVLLDGLPFSFYGLHDWSNQGLTAEEIEEKELEDFAALPGTDFEAFCKEDDNKGLMQEYHAESLMSERMLVEEAGCHYVRLPILDHTWPTPEEIDEFIDFVKSVDTDQVWLHIHCHAGSGRTGAILVIYDKMMNPEVPIEDICVRQTMLGSSYLLQTDPEDEYKIPLYEEKRKMVPLFGEYVEENAADGYPVSWSEWLAKKGEAQK